VAVLVFLVVVPAELFAAVDRVAFFPIDWISILDRRLRCPLRRR